MDFINFSSFKKILQKITQYKNNIYICNYSAVGA